MAVFFYALNVNVNRFSQFFTVRIGRKFVIILSLKIPPHLRQTFRFEAGLPIFANASLG